MSNGFRQFQESQFGELQKTNWDFDGTAEDVAEFARQNLGDVESVKDLGDVEFDVTLADGNEFRIYTA